MASDPRRDAARYRIDRMVDEDRRAHGAPADEPDAADRPDAASTSSGDEPPPTPDARQRAAIVEMSLQQAMRRGEFDDLPGAGKPLTGLTGTVHDPDWWIRRKIEREQLTGLGPPALTLRTESAELDARLDALHREDDVRQHLDDFNRRVIEARRQLQGGPPVVTPTRDVDAEVASWRERRAARSAEAAERLRLEREAAQRRSWRARLKARRGRGR